MFSPLAGPVLISSECTKTYVSSQPTSRLHLDDFITVELELERRDGDGNVKVYMQHGLRDKVTA